MQASFPHSLSQNSNTHRVQISLRVHISSTQRIIDYFLDRIGTADHHIPSRRPCLSLSLSLEQFSAGTIRFDAEERSYIFTWANSVCVRAASTPLNDYVTIDRQRAMRDEY